MTQEPLTDREDWHRLAAHAVRFGLSEARKEILGDESVELRARNVPLDDFLVVEESAEDYLFGWHTIAEYDRDAVKEAIHNDNSPGDRFLINNEEFDAALEQTWDRGERARERVRPDIEFADLEYHAWVRKCNTCGSSEVVTDTGAEWTDCCDDPERHGSPLIERNRAIDLVAAPFEERIGGMDEGPARDALSDVYRTLFPEWGEREVEEQ